VSEKNSQALSSRGIKAFLNFKSILDFPGSGRRAVTERKNANSKRNHSLYKKNTAPRRLTF